MTYKELATEAWRAWVKDKPFQSEDTAKGFQEGFNVCLLGKIKVEGGDKGELISANWSLQDKLTEAKEIITALLNVFVYDLVDEELDSGDIDVRDKAEQFLKEVKEND